MKNLKYITIGIIGMLMISSCNEWLSVVPKTEETRSDLVTKESGFKSALIGIYIQLKEDNAYGKMMTMSTVEYLAARWDVAAATTQDNLSQHKYSEQNAEAEIKKLYAKLYNIIAGCNSILDEVDKAKSNNVFTTTGMYETVKGEALAIRALCHLDILRLFGPIPSKASGSPILSYETTLGKTPNLHVTFAQYSKLLLSDISSAIELLKNDPITDLATEPKPVIDNFFTARYFRMNYYAAIALQARTNLYLGNLEAACEAAKMVVNTVKENGDQLFRLGVSADMTSGADNTLKAEHIFALNQHKLSETYENTFLNRTLYKGKTGEATAQDLFGGEVANDIRAQLWTTSSNIGGTKFGLLKKYYVAPKTSDDESVSDSRIPILRVSELYLILAEAAPIGEAQGYWEKYRKSRNLAVTVLTESTRRSSIMQEYRKEFFGEGQLFFLHKRLGSLSNEILWFNVAATVNYVLPLPTTELIN